jgi:uncharacterized protein HemX
MADNTPQINEALKKEAEKAEEAKKIPDVRNLTDNEKSFLAVLVVIVLLALLLGAVYYFPIIKPKTASPAPRQFQKQQSQQREPSSRLQQAQYQGQLGEQQRQSGQMQQQFKEQSRLQDNVPTGNQPLAEQSRLSENISPESPPFEKDLSSSDEGTPNLRQQYQKVLSGGFDGRCYSSCMKQWGNSGASYCQNSCRY